MPRLFRLILFFTASVVCGHGGFDTARAAEPAYSAAGPSADAIRLVSEKRADEVLALDGGDMRWFDTRIRTWTTHRPYGPGLIDSRFLINVTYAIDGKIVGEWQVNTCSGQIAGDGDPPIVIEGCGDFMRWRDPPAPAGRP